MMGDIAKRATTMYSCYQIALSEKANLYMKRVLSLGKTFAQTMDKVIDLRSGTCHAILTSEGLLDNLEDFEWGGKIKQGDPTRCLMTIIAKKLKQGSNYRCIIEESVASIGDPKIPDKWLKFFTYKDEIYYPLSSTDSQQSIYDTVRIAQSSSPIYVGAIVKMTKPLPENGDPLTVNDIELLATQAEDIFISAYDNESYLLWSGNIGETSSWK